MEILATGFPDRAQIHERREKMRYLSAVRKTTQQYLGPKIEKWKSEIWPPLLSFTADVHESGMPPALKRRQPPGPVAKFFAKVGDYDLLSVFDPKRPRPFPRTVLVNAPLPPHALSSQPRLALPFTGKNKVGLGKRAIPAEGWIFESNQVLTSKYNIITFLPRNLLEQFRRVANVFFLGQSARFLPSNQRRSPSRSLPSFLPSLRRSIATPA